jgi:hypothetical protein
VFDLNRTEQSSKICRTRSKQGHSLVLFTVRCDAEPRTNRTGPRKCSARFVCSVSHLWVYKALLPPTLALPTMQLVGESSPTLLKLGNIGLYGNRGTNPILLLMNRMSGDSEFSWDFNLNYLGYSGELGA